MSTAEIDSSNPSAFAIAVVFGGGIGLTLSQMLGFSGDVGFLAGSTILFVFLAYLITSDRRKKVENKVEALENEIIALRRSIYENFITTLGEHKDSLEEKDNVLRSIESIREELLAGRINRFAMGVVRPYKSIKDIQGFSKDAGAVIRRMRDIEGFKGVVITAKAIEILKQEADEELKTISERGWSDEAN